MDKLHNTASIRDVYELVERVRIELKQDMIGAVAAISNNQGSLERKFDELEAGRLTRAEEHIRRLQVTNATINVKMGVLVFIATAIVSTVISVTVTKAVGR